MFLYDVLLQSGLVTLAVVFYLTVFRKPPQKKGHYSQKGWNFMLKYLCALYKVRKWKSKLKDVEEIDESVPPNAKLGFQGISIRAAAHDGTFIFISVKKICGKSPKAEVILHITLPDGTAYKLPYHPDTVIGAWEDTSDGSWSAGGLKIHILEPGVRLRIFYNGPLERISDGACLHVRINFIWCSQKTAAIQHPKNWSSSLAAASVALESWRDGNWGNMLENWNENSWQHWGAIQGRFQSYKDGELCDNIWLRARGLRERQWSAQVRPMSRRNITLTVMSKDATMFQIKGISCKELTQAFSGVVRLPNSEIEDVTDTDLSLLEFCENKGGIPELHSLNVSSSSINLKVILKIHSNGFDVLTGGLPYQQELLYRTVTAYVNGEQAVGVLELGYELADVKDASITLLEPRILKWVDDVESFGYCATFNSVAAKNQNIVGGKGASLALLASVQHSENYKVPPGFCITTRALDKYLEVNTDVRNAILDIEKTSGNYDEKVFKEKCSRASELFVSTPMNEEIRSYILDHLQRLKQESEGYKLGTDLRFAVRSSAVGEDGDVLSAAGQNETILGCATDDDVIKAVNKCWASMYAFTSAHYRRENGQSVWCGGGVVVQSVVNGRVAGVMFTAHPSNGDSRILITATYGLGESVVSGNVEPDSIVVSRDRFNNLSISTVDIGSKAQKILTSKDGISIENVPENERNSACLKEKEILSLAMLGVRQEQLWGAPRDIEWAVREDGIYLLQARPITSIERWSAEDLLHEFDTPIMSDETLSTFANTGEVLPKPMSPLGIDCVVVPLSRSMTEMIEGTPHFVEGVMDISHYRITLNLYNTLYRRVPGEIDTSVKMMDLAIYGHLVADKHLINTARRIHPSKKMDKLILIWNMLKTLYLSKSYGNDSIKLAKEFTLDKIEGEDPLKMLDEIETGISYIGKASWNHSGTSSASTASQIIAMSILLEGGTDVTNQQCSDIGTMLGSGDAVSAELPIALKKLSKAIHNSGRYAQFKSVPPKCGLEWLESNLPEVYKDVRVFLEQHGFRALMEFDLCTRPWSLEPDKFIQVLQNMDTINEERMTENKTDAEIISSLVSPKKSTTRKGLAWILPFCRRMVVNRECTKAHLILIIHKQRLAFLRLGRLLVKKWYLPDENLIFYFNLRELRNYIQTRDPGLLRKATQRRQYFSTWEKLKFHEVNTGWVEPIKLEMPKLSSTGDKVTGTPVCAGDVVARACVITDLRDIDRLEKGDILVTYSTDIGWSPYFPLLSGIVTELGGLISHGAVIARECGLPCIVGAAGATRLFQTGDLLRLNGATGVLEKVNKPESTQTM